MSYVVRPGPGAPHLSVIYDRWPSPTRMLGVLTSRELAEEKAAAFWEIDQRDAALAQERAAAEAQARGGSPVQIKRKPGT